MPRYNVEYNGKWACFSTITDAFVTEFMDKSEYEEWRKYKYGNDYKPIIQCNSMTIQEAAFSISITRTLEESLKCMLECGLPETECKKIMYDMETIHYCPVLKSDGTFECPNCRRKIEKGQKICKGDDCSLEFVWRE